MKGTKGTLEDVAGGGVKEDEGAESDLEDKRVMEEDHRGSRVF